MTGTTSATTVRDLFTEHEDHLTADMPALVAVGYVNARRRDGRGEKAGHRLLVTGNTVTEIGGNGSLDGFNIGDLFGWKFGGR